MFTGHARIDIADAIGAGSVVAAAAVVTHDVPPGTLVAGVPATVIRELKSAEGSLTT